ncbi:phosphatidylinositol 4-kinase-like protein STT4 [Mytilinidion resinicola]|uniref:1-phosphatidylinositol 4-kinase n=1 Tax=Mytilinidion resinicola TaxID=574789 RepID=A0A6A6YMZ8_9PEZI|nr:phosphatidylinositol 4-kinase-like protein STT4 [Mytilinidion resinicola]KAF2810160.1 phosphatidylinositol 4-kinase-like protein STT4 [Mytilinidion resinicola]
MSRREQNLASSIATYFQENWVIRGKLSGATRSRSLLPSQRDPLPAHQDTPTSRSYAKSAYQISPHGASILPTKPRLPELEVLLALCKAAPLVGNVETAEQLLKQLSPYLVESHSQIISPSPGLRQLSPSPWEILTSSLASALLAIGLKYASLRPAVTSAIEQYIKEWTSVASSISADQFDDDDRVEYAADGELANVMSLSMSLLGFLDAASSYIRFWTGDDRLQLLDSIRSALTEKFTVAFEAALSVVRNAHSPQRGLKDWKRYGKHYAAMGRPLGSMLLHEKFMQLVVASASLIAMPSGQEVQEPILDYLCKANLMSKVPRDPSEVTLLEGLVQIAMDEMERLQNDLDYLQRVGSAWQQRLASAVKGNVLVTFLCCAVRNEDVADSDVLVTWLENTLTDPVQIADTNLASVVLKSLAVLARLSPSLAAGLSRSLPRVIVQGGLDSRTAAVAAECLASVLKNLPQDAIITTLYSLGNVLSSGSVSEHAPNLLLLRSSTNKPHRHTGLYSHQTAGSAISLTPSDIEEPSQVYSTIIQAVGGVARTCKDEKITALALSMLIQKIGRVNRTVDAKIIMESALLGIHSGSSELRSLLKLYVKLTHDALIEDDTATVDAVLHARNSLARDIQPSSTAFEICLVHLLETIISKGDAHENANSHIPDTELAAREIAQLLAPLAILVSKEPENTELGKYRDNIASLQRDAWFNIVVHGFNFNSQLGKKYHLELRTLATFSQPLIAEERVDQVESDVELNTVLRRGKGPEHTVEQKQNLIKLLPSCETDIKSLNHSEVVFLNTAYLVEDLRASAGDCTKALAYFLDPKLRSGAMGNCMLAIATSSVKTYVSKTVSGSSPQFSTPFLAQQLATIFAGCCHRITRVQDVAMQCADIIIKEAPSTLCQKTALFTILELLSIMWSSCLECETDEYEWTSTFTSSREPVSVELSDDYDLRRTTLNTFHKKARSWVLQVLSLAPLDIKGLLQTYLSEYDDEGAYGHVSLGRSFALEMGSIIPSTDQRLGAIERHNDLNINTASDFIAQYTTRQEYRFIDGLNDQDEEWLKFGNTGSFGIKTQRRSLTDHRDRLTGRSSFVHRSIEDATKLLTDLESRTLNQKQVSIAELRDILRRAAALLCRVKCDQTAIVQHLVGIPFAVFTKQSIKLGISLWMSVIKENPRMESRILIAITENWEATVRRKRGMFSEALRLLDPFYVKQEFAPSDKDATVKRQQQAYNIIAPHFRLLQFLSSHFNATRLGNPDIEKVYHRMLHVTLDSIKASPVHPLAREAHFHIVLLGLRVLRHCTSLRENFKWRLKDRILTAGLAWFAKSPKWSFGGNRLQIKAETHVLADVQNLLQAISHIGSKAEGPLKSLQGKQELLSLLVASEQTRLMVWLFPLDYEKKHHFTSGQHSKTLTENAISGYLKTAWAENPSLAVHLVQRFQSRKLFEDVRWLLLNFPQKVLNEPESLEILLGVALPSDVSFQLKYLLYWASVNPITAVTYFLPAYENHPFIIQYAMKALESHSVDITFFYVPQIVQTLRYDGLGYVERYIIETAKFSQLFAHQIIWNMKANAYKDEDSQIPDPVKPTLDKVTESLISSFAKSDRLFYEREFSFFNEVTGISGKLRPFIKSPKAEKKEKIEEELRKIKLEVGVYLPSNPDGVVIGIDRKSGKPLQSHAKAPYMATFRIRKEKSDLVGIEAGDATPNGDADKHPSSYEVWQSAIFKVGDDCRQDVLALQMIAAFRGIFNSVGLDVYVFPYRVTATAPGCGVIDVLPNSISRDMLGREAVNGLYDYFVSKYGGEDSIRFQEARNNFVKSMAAYSVISYLLQFKDRHNGNIMIDDAGHILHIDFGFCFDIAPGGVKFERAPFKLTSEMVAVMGGSTTSQPYRWFEELCIKSFLACREQCEHLAHLVIAMLDSGLPCFKPETIQHFRERFVLDRTEREAADFMRELIRKSYSSNSTKVYDHFQLLTNGIPY